MKLARILVFLPLAMLFLTPVHATTPVLVIGEIHGLAFGTLTDFRTTGGNTFMTITLPVGFTGGIQAQGPFTVSLMINATGFTTATVDGTFTGTVTGSSPGSAELHATATGTYDFVSKTITSLQGQLNLGSGTLGLAGLHGEGTLSHLPGAPFIGSSYSVQVHFDP